jgi:hypothetical protein
MRKNLPKTIIRLDDGVKFVLNEKSGMYSIDLERLDGKHLVWEYTYERLMEDPRNKGYFKVADGTEDLEAMRKNWLKQCESHNDGHGNGDFD